MDFTELQRQAFSDIDERLDSLCSSERARTAMQDLGLTFGQLAAEALNGTAEQRTAASILLTASCYITRSLERPELDGKVLLDTVNSLCWDRRHEVGELPDDLLDEFEQATADPAGLLAVWEHSAERGASVAMTETVMWWTVANLVTNTIHLECGEAAQTITPLLRAFARREAQGGSVQMLN